MFCQEENKQASPLRMETALEDIELFTQFIIVLSFLHPGWEQKKKSIRPFIENRSKQKQTNLKLD